MASPLLLVALTLCLPSLGSLQSRGPGSESSSESLEGSGRRADRTFWSGMIIPKRPNLSALRGEDGLNKVSILAKQNRSSPGTPCVFGLTSCDVVPSSNGTSLAWDDMRRTLAFAWELHVFGSASLFLLMVAVAGVGVAGACTLPGPVSCTLSLANGLLVLAAAARCLLLLLDPYGSRQLLARPWVAALHNLPLQLLLWAQASVALLPLRKINALLFSLELGRPCRGAALASLHCGLLLAADVLSERLSPSTPLLLHTLSLCWGVWLCAGILPRSCSHLPPWLRSSVPGWAPSLGMERCAGRVTAACAVLGLLCCGLQMYSLLWLYGLLGNWRRFGWGWWLSQFWARILELSWGFSLLVLGSWIFWKPSTRGEKAQSKYEAKKRSLWGRILAKIKKWPLKQSEQTLEELMPNNWANYNLSKTGFWSNVRCPYDAQPAYKPNPVSSGSSEAPGSSLWQKGSDRHCALSLIELDLQPPSPINLRRSIDHALHHGQLAAGGLFTPQASSWTTSVGGAVADGGDGWAGDAEPIPTGRLNQTLHVHRASSDHSGGPGFRPLPPPGVIHLQEWLDDDVTDL